MTKARSNCTGAPRIAKCRAKARAGSLQLREAIHDALAYGGRFSPENEMPVIDLLLRELKQGRLSVPDFEVSGRGRTGAEQEWVWRKVKLTGRAAVVSHR